MEEELFKARRVNKQLANKLSPKVLSRESLHGSDAKVQYLCADTVSECNVFMDDDAQSTTT